MPGIGEILQKNKRKTRGIAGRTSESNKYQANTRTTTRPKSRPPQAPLRGGGEDQTR